MAGERQTLDDLRFDVAKICPDCGLTEEMHAVTNPGVSWVACPRCGGRMRVGLTAVDLAIQPMEDENVMQAEHAAGQGGYQFEEGDQADAMYEPAAAESRWVPVTIVLRTIVLTSEGHWHPVYRVRDDRFTDWIAGDGELRRRQEGGGDGA